MFGLFESKKPVLDEDSVQWIFDAFAWAMRNFGVDEFYQKTQLITPDNRHFPGRESSVDGMAHLIFEQVRNYAGVNHWPVRLINHHEFQDDPAAEPNLPQVLSAQQQGLADTRLTFFYEPQQVANPEALIANYAHGVAHHMGFLASERPPCEEDQWMHLTEVVAVYLGFGLMLANTANPYRGGGCGRCRNPAMDRSGYLSEREVSYALAIFCVLKDVESQEVLAYIKPSLKKFFKQAVKDVQRHEHDLASLKSIKCAAKVREIAPNSSELPHNS